MGSCVVCGKSVRYTCCAQHRGAGRRNGESVPCAECGVAVYRPAHLLERNREHFCSKPCHDKHGPVKPDDDGRICSKCKTWKPRAEFGVETRTRHGMQSRCRACLNAVSQEYVATNLEKVRKTKRESALRYYYQNHDVCIERNRARLRDENCRAKMRECWRAAQQRRMADPAYRAKVNEAYRVRRLDPAKRRKLVANDRLKYAVRSGKLQRLPCEQCGDPKSHGHHDDYNKPLDVRWLCALCHGKAHRRVT